MVKVKCEQCLKEVDRPRPQPYCSPECYQLALTKRKSDYLIIYSWLIKTDAVHFPKYLKQASREGLQWQFEKQLKKETMKGSHKAFLKGDISNIEVFLEYVLNTVRVRRE
jgi:endogenous inhibitor of DNA gyrase (YacG/DUF329 family)